MNQGPKISWFCFMSGTSLDRTCHDGLYQVLFPVPWYRRWWQRILRFLWRT